MLRDVANSGDRNVIKKEAEKILKYKDKNQSDAINVRGKWNHLKVIQNVPVQHSGKYEIQQTKKTSILSTSHIFRKVLM